MSYNDIKIIEDAICRKLLALTGDEKIDEHRTNSILEANFRRLQYLIKTDYIDISQGECKYIILLFFLFDYNNELLSFKKYIKKPQHVYDIILNIDNSIIYKNLKNSDSDKLRIKSVIKNSFVSGRDGSLCYSNIIDLNLILENSFSKKIFEERQNLEEQNKPEEQEEKPEEENELLERIKYLEEINEERLLTEVKLRRKIKYLEQKVKDLTTS